MTEAPAELNAMAALKSHDAFFARIIEMIPAELYKHSLSEDNDGAENTKYYKHRKLPLTADEKKVLSKQKKAEKYGAPVKKSAGSDNDEDASDDENSDSGSDEDDEEEEEVTTKSTPSAVLSSSSCNDIETLRQRLQERIQGMKGDRTSHKPHKVQAQEAAAAKKGTAGEKDKNAAKNKKRKSGNGVKGGATNNNTDAADDNASSEPAHKAQKTASSDSPAKSSASAAAVTIASDLEFSKMLMVNSAPEPGADKNKGKPGSKVQRLKRLLEESQYKRAKLASMAKSENPAEQEALASSRWSDVLKTAAGNKSVLVTGSGSGMDAEAKLKKAIKRKEKQKQKSAEEWKARLDAVEETKTARINKREENILGRKNLKLGLVPEKDKEEAAGGEKKAKNANNNINNTKGNNKHVTAGGESSNGGAGKGRAGFEGKKKSGEFLNKGSGGGGRGGGGGGGRK